MRMYQTLLNILFRCDFQVGCTILAALLHYFLLALFCWMLCEGVLLYILIVKVFGGKAEDEVKYFYIFGWGRYTLHSSCSRDSFFEQEF